MGKTLTQQKRGKGSPTYTRPSFNFKGRTKIGKNGQVVIIDLLSCRAHTAPLAKIKYDDNTSSLIIAPEGVRIGQKISIGGKDLKLGNIMELKDIPEGTGIFNIENLPGDGGKFVKASGMSARVVGRAKSNVTVQLPSTGTATLDFSSTTKMLVAKIEWYTDAAGHEFATLTLKRRFS